MAATAIIVTCPLAVLRSRSKLTHRPPAGTPRDKRVLLAVAAGIILLGFIGTRAALAGTAGLLGADGLRPGVASVAPAPFYFAVIIAVVWVASRLSPSLGVIWTALRVSSQTALQIGAGVLGSALLVAVTYGVDLICGWVVATRVEPSARLIVDVGAYAFLYAIIAFNEELVFRGVLLESLGRLGGPFWGVAGSSMLFAMVHWVDSPSWQRLFGLFLLGLLLAELFLMMRSLWLPIAVHWGVAVISFAAVLGLPPIQIHLGGPIWLVGTADQPDAGWVMIAVLAVVDVALTWRLMASHVQRTETEFTPESSSP